MDEKEPSPWNPGKRFIQRDGTPTKLSRTKSIYENRVNRVRSGR